jgi:hypothetical protein
MTVGCVVVLVLLQHRRVCTFLRVYHLLYALFAGYAALILYEAILIRAT